MWSTSVGGHLMKVVNLTGFTVVYRSYNPLTSYINAWNDVWETEFK